VLAALTKHVCHEMMIGDELNESMCQPGK